LRNVWIARYGATSGAVRPMSSGAFTEWLPAFGESWQIVQVPVSDAGTVTPLRERVVVRPPTPLRTIGLVLKISCSGRRYTETSLVEPPH
jgi:hypothetical protein